MNSTLTSTEGHKDVLVYICFAWTILTMVLCLAFFIFKLFRAIKNNKK